MQHVLFVVAGIAMVAAGVLLLSQVVRGIARRRSLEARLARAEVLTRAQERVRARLASEEQTVAALATSLPELVRELNRADLNPQDVPPLILKLAEAVFRPDHVLLYLTDCGAVPGPDAVLHLAIQKGYGRVPDSLRTVPFGQGRIGWIARHKVDMLEEDWTGLAPAEKSAVGGDDAPARIDIAGPLLHPVGSGEQLLGVLCLGSLRIRPHDRKPMFQFVTNLGALALVNARHLDELRDLADSDAVTSLPNKRRFMGDLAGMILDAEGEGRELALLLFEIGGFKAYEDAQGHAAGATLLRQAADSLRQRCRRGDRACFYGGELFALALPGVGARDAEDVAERIRQGVESSVSHLREEPSGDGLTVRGGLACFPADGTSVAELTRNADRALLESRRGKGAVARASREHADTPT